MPNHIIQGIVRLASIVFIIVAIRACGFAAEPGDQEARAVALARRIEHENPDYVKRDENGSLVSLLLNGNWCNSTNIATIALLRGLSELRLQGGSVDPSAIRSLKSSANLSSLSFACYRDLPNGVLLAATDLPNLRRLQLIASDPQAFEYGALASMSNLTELVILYSHNFTAHDFGRLRDVPSLKSVRIESDALGPTAQGMLREFRTLTNASLTGKTTWRTNWPEHPRAQQR